jgi:acyl-CoA dehydrogenase
MAESTPIPFSDPPWLSGLPSPYYNESHRIWQKACRAFVQANLLDRAMEWDAIDTLPESVFKTFAQNHMLLPSLPAPLPVEWLKRVGIHDFLGVLKVEEFDYIHCAIFTDEVDRSAPRARSKRLTPFCR